VSVAIYFTAKDGLKYRIYDTTFGAGKHHLRAVGDPTATGRVFVPPKGAKRSYKFQPKESRMLDVESLERQLRSSAYLPTGKPGGFDGDPR
jgi:hypothetical protein